jgi:hypothetical protein
MYILKKNEEDASLAIDFCVTGAWWVCLAVGAGF